jgi:hypothetical protein
MMTSRKILGLAVSEEAIAAVEMSGGRGRRKVVRAAELTVPGGVAAADPVVLGRSLRQFLRREHFSASHAVIGLPARWLVVKEKSLPPTAPDLLRGVLTIAAEREFASDAEDLAVDYSDLPAAGDGGLRVLLVAASRRNVQQLTEAAESAGLRIQAVTSSTMALATATRRHGAAARRLVLNLVSCGAELCLQEGAAVSLLRRFSLPPCGTSPSEDWVGDLAGELRRVTALLPGDAAGTELLIWDAVGLSAGSLDALGRRLGMTTRVCRFPTDLDVDSDLPTVVGQAAAAAALAATGLDRKGTLADFLHSRLTPPKEKPFKGKVTWAVGIGVVILALAAVFVWNWYSVQRDVADLTAELKAKESQFTTAKAFVAKAVQARGWFDRRPKFLDGLREVTTAFPAEGRIWATSVAVTENMHISISGKAADHGAVTDLMDRLSKNPKLADVKSLYSREVGGGTTDVSFAITLTFAKPEAK